MDCIFCKIVAKGEIPSTNVYENENVLAFLDIGPTNKGHTLVIPKRHYENLLDTPDDDLKEVMLAVKKVAAAVIKGVEADGFNIQMSNKEAAGQVVPHAHVHIIPRFNDDGLKLWPQGKYEEGEIQDIADKIKSFL